MQYFEINLLIIIIKGAIPNCKKYCDFGLISSFLFVVYNGPKYPQLFGESNKITENTVPKNSPLLDLATIENTMNKHYVKIIRIHRGVQSLRRRQNMYRLQCMQKDA